MKVKYIGKEKMNFLVENNDMDLIPGKEYEVIEVTKKFGWYRVIDESGEDYAYPAQFFEVVDDSPIEEK